VSPRVVVLRGRQANPWDLRPWEELGPGYEVDALVPESNLYDTDLLELRRVPVRTVSGLLPSGRVGELGARAIGERYLGLASRLEGADLVHAAELGYWFSWQAAKLRRRLGFKLVLTVWETLPFLDAYRNVRTRRYRRDVLGAADLFLPTTERARRALLLEGAPEERIQVCPPGIDVDRFAPAREHRAGDGPPLVLSVGRLVWEKGHQDLLRALALLRREGTGARAMIVGVGPEERRLRAVARDLLLDDVVEFRGSIPYDEMPAVFGRAACLVLASLPTPFWEEQFGMVLAEAMAAHLPVVAAESGAIPEVLDGYGTLCPPGDWVQLAEALAGGPLRDGAARTTPDPALLERYSAQGAATRLREAYTGLLDR
jgi:glycosyltransferase involved in cell wall biosynthesis